MFFKKFFKDKEKIKSKTEQKNIYKDLDKNIILVKTSFETCSDLIIREFVIKPPYNTRAALLCLDGLVDKQTLNLEIMKPLMHDINYPQYENKPLMDILCDFTLSIGEIQKDKKLDTLIQAVLSGDTVLLLEDSDSYLIISSKGFEKRGIVEPEAETLIRGPRDGFTETLKDNKALLRRRLKTPDLKFECYTVGRRTNTEMVIAYIKGIVKPELVNEVKKRLDTIDIDGVFESGYIEAFIEDNPYSPFPQVVTTERPDKVAANLLEGRVAIMVDGTPFVMVVPAVFIQFYQSPEDYYERSIYGSGVRFFRLLGFIMGTSFPAIYVALVSFHHTLIPTKLALSLSKTREGVPFPAVAEAFFMEVTLDLLREASIRLPGNIGQTIGIVGALVLGQAAIQAKLVSPIMIIVVALTGIGTYVVPNYSTSYSLRFIRYPMLLAAGLLGSFGIGIAWSLIVIHLCTLESFGMPYLSPISPFKTSVLKDGLFRFPLWWMRTRPKTPETLDQQRIGRKKGSGKDER